MSDREKRNAAYAEKNRRRRENYDPRDRDHLIARDLRRIAGGAFGKAKPEHYNVLVKGTSGKEK